jgi:hypothetical protein
VERLAKARRPIAWTRCRTRLTSWSLAGALLATAQSVHAQEAAIPVEARRLAAAERKEDAPAGAVRVVVTTPDDRLLLTVAEPGAMQAIVSCYHQCSFWGLRGRYVLRATTPELEVDYQTTLHVGRRRVFRVSSGSPNAHVVGLLVAIAGPVVMVGGAFYAVEDALGRRQCDSSNCPPTKDNSVPAVVIASGLVLTLAGLTTYAVTEPSVEPLDDAPAEPRAPPVGLGLLALPRGGWGVGLSTLF